MGTNYYFITKEKTYHIGKSSVGWEFTWKTQRELDVYSKDQWKNFITNSQGELVDEYGEFITKVKFFGEVANNNYRKDVFSKGDPDFELKNHYLETQDEPYHFSYLDKDNNSFIMGEFS